MPVIPEALPPILDGVGDDGGVIELARDEDELLADLNFSEKNKSKQFYKRKQMVNRPSCGASSGRGAWRRCRGARAACAPGTARGPPAPSASPSSDAAG